MRCLEFGSLRMTSIPSSHVDVALHCTSTKLPFSKHVFSGQSLSPRVKRIISSQNKIKCSHPEQVIPDEPVLFKRRDAVGLGLGIGIADLLWQDKKSNAAEAASSCELTVAPSGLAFCDKVLGFGPEAVKGQLIKAHYVGKLENGKVFDSSYNRGKPLTFRVGVGEVIRGWDEGILGGDGIPPMLAGGKRSLKLPPELAYGGRGAGCKGGSCIIPPNSILLFDVEFIGKA